MTLIKHMLSQIFNMLIPLSCNSFSTVTLTIQLLSVVILKALREETAQVQPHVTARISQETLPYESLLFPWKRFPTLRATSPPEKTSYSKNYQAQKARAEKDNYY